MEKMLKRWDFSHKESYKNNKKFTILMIRLISNTSFLAQYCVL